jgi:hypothetical protein
VPQKALAGTFETVRSVGLLPAEAKFDPARMLDLSYLKD